MIECPTPELLDEKKGIAVKDLVRNHVDSMNEYAICAENHTCLVEYLKAGASTPP